MLLYEIWTGSAYVETRLMEVDDSGAVTRPAVAVASPVAVRCGPPARPPAVSTLVPAQGPVVFSGIGAARSRRGE